MSNEQIYKIDQEKTLCALWFLCVPVVIKCTLVNFKTNQAVCLFDQQAIQATVPTR
jgi:hypothetical protein